MVGEGETMGGRVLDGVQMAVIKNRFEAVCRAMTNTVVRTGRSGVLNIARDFSCVVVTAEDELLAIAESIPCHVLIGPNLQCGAMKALHPELERGDAFLDNSPYVGNTHPADWAVLVPVIDDAGKHRYTVMAKGHQADCGNSAPTTYVTTARDVYEEGALIFPCVKIQENYTLNQDIVRMLEARIRVPTQCVGDLLALVGAARVGERRVLELIREYGADTLEAFARQWFDYSEDLMAGALRGLPAGSYTVATSHDPMPVVPEGVQLRVTVTTNPADAVLDIDLTDNPDCLPCGLNLSVATASSAAMLGVFNSVGADIPPNAGSFRRIQVRLRENCCVGIPRHPVSCSVATTDLFDRIANATMRCLALAQDGLGMGEFGYCIGAGSGVISGVDAETGRPFVNQVFLGYTGGAAAPGADAWLTSYCIGAAGMLMRDSVEVDEAKYPIRIVRQHILPDTEGAGRTRGAPACVVEYGPVDSPLEIMYVADGTYCPPQGARGGLSGAGASQHRRRVDGQLEGLPNTGRASFSPGETMVASCCGGGGYGPPWQREIPLVLRDVREGWVTAERAANVYGVALTPEGDIDELQTRRLRESLGGNGSAEGSDAHRMSSITEQASLRPANAQDSTIVAE